VSTLVLSPRLRRGGRRVGLVYAGVSVLLVLALLPALHPPRPPLPPVAAFAPEAQQNPTKPPPNQASIAGKGKNVNGNGEANGGSGASPTPSPTPTPNVRNPGSDPNSKDVQPRQLNCIAGEGGPRQIEDTQSPPCIPYWKGDNGGATYTGVDVNTIHIGVPKGQAQGQEADWVKFFNDRFELYGRQVQIVHLASDCGTGGDNPQADGVKNADAAAAEGLFAVINCEDNGGQERYYYDELARKGVLSVALRPDPRNEADYAAMAPYEWNYLPGYDTDERDLAAQACAMKSTPAPSYTGSLTGTRTYGVIYSYYKSSGTNINLTYVDDTLAACGLHVKDTAKIEYIQGSDDPTYQHRNQTTEQEAQQAALQMSSDGVTTVIVLTHGTDTQQVIQAADSANWHPEWLMGNFMYNTEQSPYGPQQPTSQWNHAIGLEYHNKLVPAQDNPWYWAVSQEDPSYTWPYAPLSYYGGNYEYPALLLLFSGIQMAGPHLTPQTFQQGLWNTHFPNPPSPYFEGTVGFNQDHTMVKDRAIEWYSSSGTGPWGQSGVWCYVSHGQRYTDSNLPTGNPYFQGACDS
jgi:hypothetical protein